MQDLQLIGVHEDGEHLLLSGAGDERYQMLVDEALRAAVRRDRPRLGQPQTDVDGGLRPRDVQALIRAGASAEEAASRAGWSVEKVNRYEGPILAEREHVAGLAQQARLRSRTGSSGGGGSTLSARVTERLKARDVQIIDATWDSWRTEGNPWTVVLTFAAGGRQRQASWSFDLADRTVSAVDDEARWLSEETDETEGPIPAAKPRPHSRLSGRDTVVYDVEADGGLLPAVQVEHQDDPLDLMTAMRRRSTARARRRPGGRSVSGAAAKAVTDADRDAPAQAVSGVDQKNQSVPESQASALFERDDQGFPIGDSSPLETSGQAAPQGHDERSHQAAPEGHHQRSHQAPPEGHHERSHQAPPQAHDERLGQAPPRVRDERSDESGERASASTAGAEPEGESAIRAKRSVRQASRKPGRPSVPAWDEIMFGSRSGGVDRSSS